MSLNKLGKALGISTHQLVHFLAIFEHHESRQGSDSNLLRNLILGISIDFGELDRTERRIGGKLFEDWTDHSARTTPGSPEVDDYHIARVDEGLEVGKTGNVEQRDWSVTYMEGNIFSMMIKDIPFDSRNRHDAERLLIRTESEVGG